MSLLKKHRHIGTFGLASQNTRVALLLFLCATAGGVARGQGSPAGKVPALRPEETAKAALGPLRARVHEATEGVLRSQEAVRVLEDESSRARATEPKREEAGASPGDASPEAPTADAFARAEKRVAELEERLAEIESGSGQPGEKQAGLARSQQLFRAGEELLRAGDFAGAAPILREALDANSSDYSVMLFDLGEALYRQGLWGSALPCFRRALSRPSPVFPNALLRAMDCAYRLGRYDEVSEILAGARRGRAVDEIPPEAMYLGGKAAFRRTDVPAMQRDSEALGLFRDTPAPFDVAAAYYRGAIHLRAGRPDDAAKEFQGCDKLNAKDDRRRAQREMCWLALGRLFSTGNLDESAYWYGQIPSDSPRSAEALYEWAYTYEKDDLHEPALIPLSRLPDPPPESNLAAEVYLLRGSVLTHVRRYDDALAEYDKLRRAFAPVSRELDRLLEEDREPAHYLERLSAAREGAPASLPSVLVAWEKEANEVDEALGLIEAIENTQRLAGNARAAVSRVQADLSRGADMRLFPDLEARYEGMKALHAAAFHLGAQVAAPPASAGGGPDANQIANLQVRIGAVYAATERQLSEIPNAARARAAALRAKAAEEAARLDRATSDLLAARSEARDLAAKIAYGSFQGMRTRLHYILLASDRGTVQVALERTADAQRRTRALLFRQAVEKTLAMSPERRRAVADAYESHSRAVQAEDRRRRDQAIAQLEAYVSEHTDDPIFTPEALSRLGELKYLKENEDRPAEQLARVPGTGAPEASPAPKGCAGTVSHYEHLATSFPSYQQNDSAYFLLGYCLEEVGRPADAVRVFSDLVRRFPESSYVAEAQVRIGDLSFEEGKPESLQRAREAYSALKAAPSDPFYIHALYMLGWTYYRAGDLENAVHAFTELLDHRSAKSPDARSAGDEWAAALRQLVACFGEPSWDGLRRAKDWFDGHRGRAYEAEVLYRLGVALFEQARYPAAVDAYKRFLALEPLSPEAPRAQAKIVEAWQRESRPEDEARERETLLSTYDEAGAWWRKNGGDAELARDVRALRDASLYSTATIHLAAAQSLRKTGQGRAASAEYQRAEQSFSRYLDSSPTAAVSGDVLFAWAETAYHAEDYQRAAELYEKARDDAGTKSQRDAALNAVVAWNAAVARARKIGDAPQAPTADRKGAAAEALPMPLAGFVRASDAFVERFPDHARAPAVAYQVAEIYHQRGQGAAAQRRLEEVVERWPTSAAAQDATHLVFEGLLAAKDWASVESTARRLRVPVGDKNPALASQLLELEASSRFQRALALMEQKQWGGAAQLFTAVASDAPKAGLADKSLYNAAICREGEGRMEVADGLYERLVSDYPASPLAEEALFRLARGALGAYQPERALAWFDRFVDRYPKSARRGDAIFGSGLSRELLGRYGDAAASFERYAELSPGARDAPAVLLRAARLRERTKDWAGVVKTLQPVEARFAKATDRTLLVEWNACVGSAEESLGRGSSARRHYATAADEFARQRLDPITQPAAAAAAAEARFKLAEGDLERYERLTLPATSNAARLEKALAEKVAALKRQASAYEAVSALRQPEWTLAASYRQGYLLETFARSLLEAPVPPELKAPGQEAYLAAYRDQLAQVAKPYEDRAVQVYSRTLEAAREVLVANDWTAKATAALARLRPGEHPRRREMRWVRVPDAFAPPSNDDAAAQATALRARLQADPRDAAVRTALVSALVAAGRLGDAEQVARDGLRASSGDVASLVALASVFHAQGRLDLARAVIEDAARLAPQDAAVWNGRAWVELGFRRPQAALEGWKKAVELRPALATAQANYGWMLALAGDAPGAAAALEVAVKSAPDGAAAWTNLGNALAAGGRFAEARGAYERAISIAPGGADTYFNLGVLYLEGDSEVPTAVRLRKAVGYFDESASHGGSDPALAAYREEARRLLAVEERRVAPEPGQGAKNEAPGRNP